MIVPNKDLKPEQAYNGEVTLSKSFTQRVNISATYFYTYLTDLIVRRDFTFNGQDSILYDGVLSKVQANVNAGNAYIHGFSITILADLSSHISLKSSLNQTTGLDLSDLADVPLGHIPPMYGKSSLIYHRKKLKVSFFSIYNGWKRWEDYSPFNEDKRDEAIEDIGTPAWYTLNMRVAYQIHQHLRLQAGIENALDTYYKPFSSGIGAPGRNLVIAIKGNL